MHQLVQAFPLKDQTLALPLQPHLQFHLPGLLLLLWTTPIFKYEFK